MSADSPATTSAHRDDDDGQRLPVPREGVDVPAVADGVERGGRWLMNRLSRRLPIDEQLHETAEAACRDRWSVAVQPPKHADDDLLPAGERLCRALHGEIARCSMEIHKTREDGIEFHFVVGERDDAERVRELVISEYPNAEADIERSQLPIHEGDLCAVDRVELDEDYLLPVRSPMSADPPDGDPLGGLLDTLGDTHDGRCVLQTVVEASERDWTTRHSRGTPLRREDHRWWRLPPDRVSRWDAIPEAIGLSLLVAGGWWAVGQWFAGLTPGVQALFGGLGLVCVGYWWATMFGHPRTPARQTSEDVAHHLRDNPWSETRAASDERQTADAVERQAREPAFRVSQRLITVGRSAEAVTNLRDRVASQLGAAFHDPATDQGVHLSPCRRLPTVVERVSERSPIRRPVTHALDRTLSRSRRQSPRWCPPGELAAVAGHLPDESSVSKGAIDFAAPRLRTPVPPSAPRYRRPGDDGDGFGEHAPRDSPLARAGRLFIARLPRPLADRLAERGVGIEQRDDGVPVATLPEWVTDEASLDIDGVAHRETAQHKRYGDVEIKLIKDDDPTTHEDDGDVWMGSFLREILESKRERPRGDLLVGYQERGGTVREVCVPFDTVFRHVFVQGVTGAGKSTLASVLLAQWAHAGYGFAVPDPSGELVGDILRWLPDHRHDDVVWYAPEPDLAEKIVGINPLTIPQESDDDDFGRAVDLAVDEVVNGLQAGEEGAQWGARMVGVCRNLARVMIGAEETFTLVDLHDAIATENGREDLAERAGKTDEWVAKYTRKIASFDDDELDALLRRLNEWVESTVSRTTVAVRESSLDLEEIVNEGKILLFDNKLSNRALSMMLATIIWSRIWNICRRRPEDEREPYCVLADEFDDYVTPNMDVDVQVRNARKYKLSLILMTQYLEAIGNKDVENAIDEECSTEITLRIKGENAPSIASRLGLDNPEYLTKLERFHALVEIEIGNKTHGPFEIELPAPVAPERTAQEAHETIVEPALDRNGQEPLSDEEIHKQQVLGNSDKRKRFTTTSEDGSVVEDDPVEITDERKRAVVRAIHDEALVRGGSDGVKLDHAAERIRQYHDRGDELASQSLSTVINRLPTGEDGLIERREDDDGDIWVHCTATGRTLIFDTGRSGSSGGAGHDQLLRDAYEPLTTAGLTVEIEAQTGGEQADATGTASPTIVDREEIGWSNLTHADKRAMTGTIAEDHPQLAHLLLGRDAPLSDAQNEDNEGTDTDVHPLRKRDLAVSIEAEKSTGSSKGGYTARNVAKAVKSTTHERCLLLCRPDTAPKVARTLTEPPFVTSRGTPDGHEHRFYNLDNLVIAGELMLRPERPDGQDHTVWSRDAETDDIVLSDTGENEHARFEDDEAVFGGPRGYPMTAPAEEITDASDIPDGYKAVKKPFLPCRQFPDGIPDDNEWEIVIVPPDADRPGDLAVYRDGQEITVGDIDDYEQDQVAQDRQEEIMTDLLEEFDRR